MAHLANGDLLAVVLDAFDEGDGGGEVGDTGEIAHGLCDVEGRVYENRHRCRRDLGDENVITFAFTVSFCHETRTAGR